MNNLRSCGGRVPIRTADPDRPIRLVDFPNRSTFESLYSKRVTGENVGRYWEMLTDRAKGATLADAAKKQGITRERLRQIEAKFLRLMRKLHEKKPPVSAKA